MCVLVVEDDRLIRLILVEELQDAGYIVKEAENGDLAVAALQTLDIPLSVLVTDIHMPGSRDGMEVAAHVQGSFPHVPVVYTTGRPDVMVGKIALGSRQVLVRKPYVPSQVVEQVRKLTAIAA